MANNWADLHRDVLGEIFKRLGITSHSSFKLVCKSWYFNFHEEADLSISYPIKSPPWLTVPIYPEEDGDNSSSWSVSYYNLTNKKVFFDDGWRFPTRDHAYCVGSCHGWLAFLDIKCVLYLKNPFIESSVIKLPPIETLPCILSAHPNSSPLGLIDFMYYQTRADHTYMVSSDRLYDVFVSKLVMSSSPNDPSCIVMIIFGELSELAYCKVGDTSWTKLDGKIACNYEIYYSNTKQQFYALCWHDFSFETWNLADFYSATAVTSTLFKYSKKPLSLSTDESNIRSICNEKAYLAETQDGNLLWVLKYFDSVNSDGQIYNHEFDHLEYNLPYKTYRFDVYQLDSTKEEWAQVNCLDKNDVLFLGMNNPMVFSASDFPFLQGNSIYFTDDCLEYQSNDYGGHDLGIYNLEDDTIDPCYYPIGFKKICPPPIWISPYTW